MSEDQLKEYVEKCVMFYPKEDMKKEYDIYSSDDDGDEDENNDNNAETDM